MLEPLVLGQMQYIDVSKKTDSVEELFMAIPGMAQQKLKLQRG
jgi:hypothetical protein